MALTKVQGEGISGVSISANNEITMSSQPAFSVNKGGTSQAGFSNNSSDITVPFSTERFDNNADFASNTFTAPVTGKYFLSVQLRLDGIDSAADYYIPKIQTSNHNYFDIIDPNFASDLSYFTQKVTVLADMDANDTAFVSIAQSGGTQQTNVDGGNSYTYFTGFLVC